MAKQFEVGKIYEAYQREYGAIKILRRTDKTVWVRNGWTNTNALTWAMRIKHDADGDEYVTDSAVDRKWREAFTYSAKWEKE